MLLSYLCRQTQSVGFMKKIIIIGATSGIGRGLAEQYACEDCLIGITGRRENLLKEICAQDKDKRFYQVCDITHTETTISSLETLVQEMGGMDMLIISAGTGELNPQLSYQLEEPTLRTNVVGFTNIADWGFRYFEQQKGGHLITISSVGGTRGSGVAPAYNASKAYQINYMEGLRQKAAKLPFPIYTTDIRPGFVDTAMAKGEGLFWVTPVDKAVKQIKRAISKKKKIVFIAECKQGKRSIIYTLSFSLFSLVFIPMTLSLVFSSHPHAFLFPAIPGFSVIILSEFHIQYPM